MKLEIAGKKIIMLGVDGSFHFPYSKFLTDYFSNPHTRELVAQSLRIFHKFCIANKIELALRGVEGRCLTYNEAKNLIELCYLPLKDLEVMSEKKIINLSVTKQGRPKNSLNVSVEPNTAKKRLNHIAQYLRFYREVFLEPCIRSHLLRESLKSEYEKVENQLRRSIRGTKQNHHLAIKSLPTDKYLEIIEEVFLRPEKIFITSSGRPSRTLLRDRAMTLLACEGLRPGTLGNIMLSDFRENSGYLVIKDNRAKRTERITTNTPKLKMGDSVSMNNASESMISLWPFTVNAIVDYLDKERCTVLNKRLRNKSNGFLFLSVEGEPIKHRSSITEMFNKLGKALKSNGFLDIGDDPYFSDQSIYDFYGYILRHSAANFFLSQKMSEIRIDSDNNKFSIYDDVPDRIKDMMKLRFGWTMNSKMPELYAARAISENANTLLMEFNKNLMEKRALNWHTK